MGIILTEKTILNTEIMCEAVVSQADQLKLNIKKARLSNPTRTLNPAFIQVIPNNGSVPK